MRRTWIISWRSLAAAVMLAVSFASAAADDADRASALRYRRVLAPENRIADWPLGGEPYLPIEASEFERLVGESKSPQPTAGPQVAEANYAARLSGASLVDGRAELRLVGPVAHPQSRSLGNVSLSITDPRWLAENRPALIGLSPRGDQVVLVDREGVLGFDWTLTGEPDGFGGIRFDARFPNASFTSLTLRLPDSLAPRTTSAPLEKLGGFEPGWSAWRITLGGAHRATFRILPTAAEHAVNQPTLRQLMRYELTPHGVHVTARMAIETHGRWADRLRLVLEAPLQLSSARLRGVELGWTELGEAGDGQTQIELELPSPLEGQDELEISAGAALSAGSSWRLPTVRLPELFWSDGQIEIIAHDPLVIEDASPVDSRQISGEDVTDGGPGEKLTLQAFGPSATAEVRATRAKLQISARTGTTWRIGEHDTTGRQIALFSARGGAVHLLTADVPPQWILDSVVAEPDDSLQDWEVVDGEDGQRVLNVFLARALAPNQSVRIEVAGRSRRAGLVQPSDVAQLRMLQWLDVDRSEDWAEVCAASPFQLRVDDLAALPLVDPSELDDVQRGLVDEQVRGLIFPLPVSAESPRFYLQRAGVAFTARLSTEIHVEQDGGLENFRLECTPVAGQLDRLLVYFNRRRSDPPRWSLVGGSAADVTASKLTPQELQSLGLGSQGEGWDIRIGLARSAPFVVTAQRNVSLVNDKTDVCLVALPQASDQSGRLTVYADANVQTSFPEGALEPIPVPVVDGESQPPQRAALRYNPARFTLGDEPVTLFVAPTGQRGWPAELWAWRCLLETWASPQGNQIHTASYALENISRRQFVVTLPPGAQAKGVFVDGCPTPTESSDAASGGLSIPLPAGRRRVLVVVQFETRSSALGVSTRLTPSLPKVDAPVLGVVWNVRLPREYRPIDASDLSAMGLGGWVRRLLGPFAPDGLSAASAPVNSAAGLAGTGAEAAPSPWPKFTTRPAQASTWPAVQVQFAPDDAASIRAVNDSAWKTLTLGAFLIAAILMHWSLARFPLVVVVVLGTAALLAVVAPAALAPAAFAVFAGSIVGLLMKRLPRVNRPEPLAARDLSTTKAVVARSLGWIVALAVALAVTACLAVEPDAGATGSDSEIYSVFIPVDSNQNPVGDKYYVPESLFRALTRRAAAQSSLVDWIIQKAEYRGVLAWNAERTDLVVQSLEAFYDITVFKRQVRIRLPHGLEDVARTPVAVRLDGRNIPATFDETSGELLVPVAEPGAYRLAVALRPKLDSASDLEQFAVAIPWVVDAKLELVVPSDSPECVIPGRVSVEDIDSQQRTIKAELGPVDLLSVAWPVGPAELSQQATVDAEELLWLNADLQQAVWTLRVKLNVLHGATGELRLEADPRLTLLPFDDQSPIKSQRIVAGDPQQIVLELASPAKDHVELDLRFYVEGGGGVGRYRLPQLKLIDVRTTRRLIGVSVASNLEAVGPGEDADAAPLAAPDFQSAWGEGGPLPALAYSLPEGDSAWFVSVRPKPAEIHAPERLAVFVGPLRADLLYSVTLPAGSGDIFRHRFAAPGGVQITAASVVDDDVSRSLPWRRDPASGDVTLLLPGASAAERQIVLRGEIPIPANGRLPIPRIERIAAPTDAERTSQDDYRVEVYRRAGVLVDVEGSSGSPPAKASPTSSPADNRAADSGRLVGAYLWDESSGDMVMVVRPNRPNMTATLITTMRPQREARGATDSGWDADLAVALRVAQGEVEVLKFEAPQWWGGGDASTFVVDPPAVARLIALPDESRRQLVLRFSRPLVGDVVIRIRSSVRPSAGQRIRAPDITLLSVKDAPRYVAAPRRAGTQRLLWETSGLVESGLSAMLRQIAGVDDQWMVYRAAAGQFQAVQSVAAAARTPTIPLEDIRVAIAQDDAFHGVATFDLAPGGLTTCDLEVPAEADLVWAEVDGTPALLQPRTDDRWRISLGLGTAPHRVAVIFAGDRPRATASSERRPWRAPRLYSGETPIEVERTLWTISRPRPSTMGPSQRTSAADRFKLEVARLRTIETLTAAGAEVLADQPSDVVSAWYGGWATRLEQSRRKVEALAAGDVVDQADVDLTRRIVDQQTELARRLNATDQWTEILRAPSRVTGDGPLWDSLVEEATIERYSQSGDATSFPLRLEGRRRSDWGVRIPLGLLILAATGLAIIVIRRESWRAIQEYAATRFAGARSAPPK